QFQTNSSPGSFLAKIRHFLIKFRTAPTRVARISEILLSVPSGTCTTAGTRQRSAAGSADFAARPATQPSRPWLFTSITSPNVLWTTLQYSPTLSVPAVMRTPAGFWEYGTLPSRTGYGGSAGSARPSTVRYEVSSAADSQKLPLCLMDLNPSARASTTRTTST